MSVPNILVIKVLLLLWILCVVFCEHQKRDVHRIVIKQRIPRSHKKGRSHSHGHKHNHHYSNSGRSNSHRHNKVKNHSSFERDSFEDDDSYSRENSFEDILQKHKFQGHKSNHHDKKKFRSHPSSYQVNQDYEESKQIPYKDESKLVFQNEWIPLSSEQFPHGSREIHRDRYKKKRDSRKSYRTSLKPPPIEITTSYPFQFSESSSVFPHLISYPGGFSNFNFDKKTIESNQSPLIGTIEQPKIQFSELKDNFSQLRNRASYEVTELTASDSNTNTLISIPDDSAPVKSDEVTTKSTKNKKEDIRSTQRPIRTRGRATYRGQSKN